MKVLISGGGIGGLTTALCCLHYGHDVTILERSDAFKEVGAGIQIPPNAMKVFAALGLTDVISKNAFRPTAIENRMGISGQRVFTVPLGDAVTKRWGAPYLHIHRADYIDALSVALSERAPGSIKFGAELTRYEQSADTITAHLASGQTITGDILIGADGIHSPIRTQMLGADTPVFTGNVAWRAVVPIDQLGDDAPAPTACAWMGRGKHAVTYRLRGGKLANFVGVVERDDWTKEGWHEEGTREDAARDFAGWHPTITRLIAQAPTLHRWALFDRAPLSTWTGGRAALLGDAAHPMLPFMAQGAAMAVEDAWALADEISQSDRSIAASLKTYQSRRYHRATTVQAASRANAKTFHQRSNTGRIATYGPMWLAGRLAPAAIKSRLDKFYKYDVTNA